MQCKCETVKILCFNGNSSKCDSLFSLQPKDDQSKVVFIETEMTYDLRDYFTLSEEYEITNVTKRKSKTGQGKCLGSGEFRDIVPRQQSPTPSHFSTCLHLISAQVDKKLPPPDSPG